MSSILKQITLCCLYLLVHQATAQHKLPLIKLSGQELKSNVRVQFTPVQMPLSIDPALKPTMGLWGLHYLAPINSKFYGGLGMKAAVTGDQGGLFTLGVDVGFQQKIIPNLLLDANFHFGGGGGYRYLVNDGAFVNPNIGLKYCFDQFNVGLQYAHLNFYTGKIKSNSVSVFIEIPSVLRFTDYKNRNQQFESTEADKNTFWDKWAQNNAQQIRFDYFFPFGNSRNDNNNQQSPLTNTLHVLGFEYQKYIQPKTFVYVHTDAIYKGLTAGFMDLFIGAGYHPYKSKDFNFFTKFGLGAAGGRVAPEGGLMMYPSIGIDYKIYKQFSVTAHGGYYRALDGDLEAYTLGFGIKYNAINGGVIKNDTETYNQFKTKGIRVGVYNQRYLKAHRVGDIPIDLDLIALHLSYDLTKYLFAVGETAFSYTGESGGFAHGLVGLGLNSPTIIKDNVRFYTEVLAGAAGGGGVDTGEGVVIKPSVGVSCKLYKPISLYASYGKVISPFGNLNTLNINAGLTFDFSVLAVKE